MYSCTDVVAVIVSWNCGGGIFDCVRALCAQVAEVLILDNNSSGESKSILQQLEGEPACTVRYGSENAGIAARLNEALLYAAEGGYPLLLTMDQDAVLHDGCVQSMLDVLNASQEIAAVGPYQSTIRSVGQHPEGYIIKDYLITAGCLVRVQAAKACGGYRTELFVDQVDIAFSLALRACGYKLALSVDAGMEHAVGVYETRRLCGLQLRYLSHSPDRYYSMFRNTRFTVRNYWKRFPLFCLKMLLVQDISGLRTILEKDGCRKVCRAWKGIFDGWRMDCGAQDRGL